MRNAALKLFEKLKPMTHRTTNLVCKFPESEVGLIGLLTIKEIASEVGLSTGYTQKLLLELCDHRYLALCSTGGATSVMINYKIHYTGDCEPNALLRTTFSCSMLEVSAHE